MRAALLTWEQLLLPVALGAVLVLRAAVWLTAVGEGLRVGVRAGGAPESRRPRALPTMRSLARTVDCRTAPLDQALTGARVPPRLARSVAAEHLRLPASVGGAIVPR